MNPHRTILPLEREKATPATATDFVYLKADCTSSDDKENPWATTLTIIDENINYLVAVAVEAKGGENTDYMVKMILTLMK